MTLLYYKMIPCANNCEQGEDMLQITRGAVEACAPNKARINIVCPELWIHYVLDGKGYFNGQHIEGGMAFITYENSYCEYYPDKDRPWSYAWINLRGDDTDGLLKAFGFPSETSVFDFDYGDRLRTLIPALLPDIMLSQASYQYSVSVARLILSLNCRDKTPSATKGSESLVSAAKSYIDLNLHKELKIEQLASTLHIDRKYLRNLFKKYTGLSTLEYLLDRRIKRAQELLEMTDVSIGTVAASVGYTDQLTFSRMFKKHVGISPIKYRNAARTHKL